MAGGYLVSFLRAANSGVKVRPPKRGSGKDFRAREFMAPNKGHSGHIRILRPEESLEIGSRPQTHWTVDGAPLITTENGRDTLRVSVHERMNAMQGLGEKPERLADLTTRSVILDFGKTPTRAEKLCGVEPVKEKEIKEGGVVHFFVGNTLDGKACYLRIEHVQPREA